MGKEFAYSVLDARSFYEKWLCDIGDCQDTLSGHIQYTAPYIRSGGGPGGWGCAIVEVPYQFYMHYGDSSVLEECYPNVGYDADDVLSLLIHLGYLGFDDGRSEVFIPNREILDEFRTSTKGGEWKDTFYSQQPS